MALQLSLASTTKTTANPRKSAGATSLSPPAMHDNLCIQCKQQPSLYDDWCHDCAVDFYMSDDAERQDLFEQYAEPNTLIKNWTPLIVALWELE